MFRAAQTQANSSKLCIRCADKCPEPGAGEVLVQISASYVAPYIRYICDPQTTYETPERPFTPGTDAIGKVLKIGAGVSNVREGDMVFADLFIDGGWDGQTGEAAFAGNFALSASAPELLAKWHNGTFASHIVLPAECVTDVAPALAKASAETLTRLGWFGTALGALDRGGFQAGQHVAVLGASGQLGSSVVLLALSLGASRVTCVGRSIERMAPLKGLDARVELALEAPRGTELVVSAADGDITSMIEHSIAGLKRDGCLVVLASPSSPPRATGLVTRNIAIVGSFWFPRDVPSRLVGMIADGTLDLSMIRSHTFSLEAANDAMQRSVQLPPLEQSVLVLENRRQEI
jgi:alcohol dehydrogenase